MNKQRLLILAKHLDKHVALNEFSLGTWKRVTPECGTVACACGHAANIPAFREAGFHLEGFWKGYIPSYENRLGWNAVTAFFGIERDDAYFLFSDIEYEGSPTPQDVAARIEEYVKKQETP